MRTKETVAREMERFRAALPELLITHPGQWVVFSNGSVIASFSSADDAYELAAGQFGPDGEYIVAPVTKEVATPISAAYQFY